MKREVSFNVTSKFDDENESLTVDACFEGASFVADVVAVLEHCHEDMMKKLVAHAKTNKIDMSNAEGYMNILSTLRVEDIQ